MSTEDGATRPDQDAVVVTAAVLRDWPLPAAGVGKEARGRTLIVGGSVRTPGAVLLAAEAALRSGAGKLQIATVESLAGAIAIALPEALVLPLAETAGGGISPRGADEVLELAQDASAVLIGPGMWDEGDTCALVEAVVQRLESPLVLDAMGLAVVTRDPTSIGRLRGRVVLTPNRKELALMLHADEEEIDRDPGGAARRIARLAGAAVTAGGEESWTAAADGRSWRDPSGGIGLGVSGSGDVFAGIVTGLCARGAEPEQAAVWASFLHGRAGDRLASTIGRLGFLARELLPCIPGVLSEIEV